jgi:hypothetical protein
MAGMMCLVGWFVEVDAERQNRYMSFYYSGHARLRIQGAESRLWRNCRLLEWMRRLKVEDKSELLNIDQS